MRASYNLEIPHCDGGMAGRQNEIIILGTGSFHHLPFLLALIWFPRESHSSEGETAKAGLLDAAQLNSKGFGRII